MRLHVHTAPWSVRCSNRNFGPNVQQFAILFDTHSALTHSTRTVQHAADETLDDACADRPPFLKVLKGLRVGGGAPAPNSVVVVLPRMTAPLPASQRHVRCPGCLTIRRTSECSSELAYQRSLRDLSRKKASRPSGSSVSLPYIDLSTHPLRHEHPQC